MTNLQNKLKIWKFNQHNNNQIISNYKDKQKKYKDVINN